MNSTLLALGIALVLALSAALTAPLFVDWNQHRGWFEAELSALIGESARIAGPIDARLLPVPRFDFADVTLGEGPAAVRMGELRGALSLGSLLRGEIRAEEIVLMRPIAVLPLATDGRVALPRPPSGRDMAADRIVVRDGRLTLTDARAARTIVLDDIDVSGELKSLAGPGRFDGRLVADGTPVLVKLVLGRRSDDGVRLRLGTDTGTGVLGDIDGVLALDGGVPRLAGQFTVTRVAPAGGADAARLRLAGSLEATPDAARFDKLTLTFGPEDRAIEMEGAARLALGRTPRLEAALSARQIDLDRLAGAAPGSAAGAPLAVLAQLAGGLESLGQPRMTLQLGVSADGVLLGGDTLRDLRLDLSGGRGAWSFDLVDVRLPGRTVLTASGEAGEVGTFRGPVRLEVGEPAVLLQWLHGGAPDRGVRGGGFALEARVEAGPGRIALERLQVDGAGARLGGRLVWARPPGGGRGRLDLALSGQELDLDGLLLLARSAGHAPLAALPGEARFDLALSRVAFAGETAQRVDAKLAFDAGALTVERLAVAGFGGLSLEGRGHLTGIGTDAAAGRLSLDVATDGPAGVAALLRAALPDVPGAVATRLTGLASGARLSLGLSGDGGPTVALVARGALAGGRLDLKADLPVAAPAATRVVATLDGEDQAPLLGLVGLTPTGRGPGRLAVEWGGLAQGGAPVSAKLVTRALEADAQGRVQVRDGLRIEPDLAVRLVRADFAEFGLSPTRTALPVDGSARLTRSGEALALDALSLRVAGARVGGALTVALAAPATVSGRLQTEQIEADALVRALVGASGRAPGWSGEAFAPPPLGELRLDLALTANRLVLYPPLVAGEARLTLKHAAPRSEIELDGGRLAGGALAGRLVLVRGEGGVALEARTKLDGADLAQLLPGAPPRPAGRVTLALDATATGRSPATIVAALAGQGALRVEGLSWPQLSPAAFGPLAELARDGAAPDERKVMATAAAALARGPLPIGRLTVPIGIVAGQMRTGTVADDTGDVRATGSLAIDLARLTLTAAVDLSPRQSTLPGAPDLGVRWAGPLAAVERKLDVTALVTSLSLAAVERETKLLEEREAKRVLSLFPPPVEAAPTVLPPPGTPVDLMSLPLPEEPVPAPALSPPVAIPQPAPPPGLRPPQPAPPPASRPPTRPSADWLGELNRPAREPARPAPPPVTDREPAPTLPPPLVITPPPGSRFPSRP